MLNRAEKVKILQQLQAKQITVEKAKELLAWHERANPYKDRMHIFTYDEEEPDSINTPKGIMTREEVEENYPPFETDDPLEPNPLLLCIVNSYPKTPHYHDSRGSLDED